MRHLKKIKIKYILEKEKQTKIILYEWNMMIQLTFADYAKNTLRVIRKYEKNKKIIENIYEDLNLRCLD